MRYLLSLLAVWALVGIIGCGNHGHTSRWRAAHPLPTAPPVAPVADTCREIIDDGGGSGGSTCPWSFQLVRIPGTLPYALNAAGACGTTRSFQFTLHFPPGITMRDSTFVTWLPGSAFGGGTFNGGWCGPDSLRTFDVSLGITGSCWGPGQQLKMRFSSIDGAHHEGPVIFSVANTCGSSTSPWVRDCGGNNWPVSYAADMDTLNVSVN